MSGCTKRHLKQTYEKRCCARSDAPDAEGGGPPFGRLKDGYMSDDKATICHTVWQEHNRMKTRRLRTVKVALILDCG